MLSLWYSTKMTKTKSCPGWNSQAVTQSPSITLYIVMGNASGVLFASFFSYFMGFTGPFAFCGIIFVFYAIF